MGYFTALYVAKVTTSASGIVTETSIYASDVGEQAYFSFGPGQQPNDMHRYAEGAVLSDKELRKLPAYPRSDASADGLFEADYRPRDVHDAVLFYVELPPRFIPRRTAQPFEQPASPFVWRWDQHLIAVYSASGPSRIRFYIEEIPHNRSMDSYDATILFSPDERRSAKVGLRINFGVFSWEVK